MGDAYWEATQAVLQSEEDPLVRKPRLTDQLLQRPPFRFLHDVISAVQARTGFAPGLFNEEEQDSKLIKDKDRKVAYLTKIVDVVGLALGTPVPARPLKVVAGLEPENTNAFLQLLGKACQIGDAQDVVARVLAGEHQPGGGAGASTTTTGDVTRPEVGRPASRPSSQHSTRLSRQNSSSKSDTGVERAAAAALASQPSTGTQPAPQPRISNTGSDPGSSQPDLSPLPAENLIPVTKQSTSRAPSKRRSSPGDSTHPAAVASGPPVPPQPDALGDSPGYEAANAAGLDLGATPFVSDGLKPPLQRRSQRPQSAKRPPPKVKSAEQQSGTRKPSSNGPGRPPTSSSTRSAGSSQGGSRPKLFIEGEELEDEDDIDIVDESVNVHATPASQHGATGGALVKDILEAEQRVVEAESQGEEGEKQQQGIVLQRRRRQQQEAPGKSGDLGKLRNMVQSVCQSVTPLGRCLEFLQEDVEAMGKEARFWATERKVYQDKVDQALGTSGDDLGYLESLIQGVDDQIQQIKDKIMAGKAQVLNNHQTIVNLLLSVSNKGH